VFVAKETPRFDALLPAADDFNIDFDCCKDILEWID
jgi:hypothetical protein